MLVVVVVLLMFVLPIGSGTIELVHRGAPYALLAIYGKWFVFWGIGVRLFTAGIRQMVRPGLTSEGILKIPGRQVWILVRELGSANVCLGLIAIVSLWRREWLQPSALAGGLFFVFAGVFHVVRKGRDFEENLVMFSDFLVAAVALSFFFFT